MWYRNCCFIRDGFSSIGYFNLFLKMRERVRVEFLKGGGQLGGNNRHRYRFQKCPGSIPEQVHLQYK
jgi:hypothetical protein